MSRSSINRALVHRKIQRLKQYLEELVPASQSSFEQYQEDVKLRRQAERSLELAIMAACDINAHLIARLTGAPPADYYQSFLDLAQLGVYPDGFARKIAPAAGLRNRLQHEYNQIDDARVHQAISQAVGDFAEYMRPPPRSHFPGPSSAIRENTKSQRLVGSGVPLAAARSLKRRRRGRPLLSESQPTNNTNSANYLAVLAWRP